MAEVLSGLAVFGVVIGLGWLLVTTRALPADADSVLTRLCFFAATPALLVTTLAQARLGAVLSKPMLVALAAEVLTILSALAVHRLLLGRRLNEALISALASGYVNAANLGIPVTVLVLGDATAVAPVLLLQLLFITPASFMALDTLGRRGRSGDGDASANADGARQVGDGHAEAARADGAVRAAGEGDSWTADDSRADGARGSLPHTGLTAAPWGARLVRVLARTAPLRNPLLLGVLAGVAVNLVRIDLRASLGSVIWNCLDLLGRTTVPLMMLALGMSLAASMRVRRQGFRKRGEALAGVPAQDPAHLTTALAVAWKLLVAPGAAVGIGLAVGLRGGALLVPVVTAALPTAQNVFMYASRYEVGKELARDTVLASTAGFVPVVLLAAALLH